MSEENLLAGVLQAQVRVDSLPAPRHIVAVERQIDGSWRIAGSGTSDESGLAELLIRAQYQSDIYALAIDEWGSKWEANMVVSVGELVRPSSFVGWLYRVTQAGTLPAAEPEWWNSAAIGPQPVGTATLEAVRYYRPLAHGPLAVQYADVPWGPEYLISMPQVLLDDQSGISDLAGAASAWSDASGNGFDFLQPTASARPLILTAGIGGRRSLRFDGSNDRLLCDQVGAKAMFSGVESGWFFIVTAKTSIDSSPANRDIFRVNVGSGIGARFICQIGTADVSNGQSRLLLGARRLDSDGFGYIASAAGVLIDTEPHMYAFKINWATGIGEIVKDGVLVASGAITSAGVTSTTVSSGPVNLGADQQSSRAYNGDCAVALAGNVMPTSDEWLRLEGWAAWRFGLVDKLPESHPYKMAAPTL